MPKPFRVQIPGLPFRYYYYSLMNDKISSAPAATATEPPVAAGPAATDAAAHRVGRNAPRRAVPPPENEQAHAWFQRPPEPDPTRTMQNSTATAHVRSSTPSGHMVSLRRPQSAPASTHRPRPPFLMRSLPTCNPGSGSHRGPRRCRTPEPFASPRAPLPTQVFQPFDPRALRAIERFGF